WRNLRTLFRDKDANDQIDFDRFNWAMKQTSPSSCDFTYEDAKVKIVKTVAAGERPFELNVDTSVTNKDSAAHRHRFSIGAFALHTNDEMKGSLGKQSQYATELSCAHDKDVLRKSASDFKEGWFSAPLIDRYAAISNSYFTQALIPRDLAAGEAAQNTKPE